MHVMLTPNCLKDMIVVHNLHIPWMLLDNELSLFLSLEK